MDFIEDLHRVVFFVFFFSRIFFSFILTEIYCKDVLLLFFFFLFLFCYLFFFFCFFLFCFVFQFNTDFI